MEKKEIQMHQSQGQDERFAFEIDQWEICSGFEFRLVTDFLLVMRRRVFLLLLLVFGFIFITCLYLEDSNRWGQFLRYFISTASSEKLPVSFDF